MFINHNAQECKNRMDHQQPEGFFYRPTVISNILRVFYAICVLLVIADFMVHRHIITDVERVPAFYALYGFIACVVLVLIASQMRKWLMRDEDYYDEGDDNKTDELKINTDTPQATKNQTVVNKESPSHD